MTENGIDSWRELTDINQYVKKRVVDRLIKTIRGDDLERKPIAIENLFDICNNLVKTFNANGKRIRETAEVVVRNAYAEGAKELADMMTKVAALNEQFWDDIQEFLELQVYPVVMELFNQDIDETIFDKLVSGIPLITNIKNKQKISKIIPFFQNLDKVKMKKTLVFGVYITLLNHASRVEDSVFNIGDSAVEVLLEFLDDEDPDIRANSLNEITDLLDQNAKMFNKNIRLFFFIIKTNRETKY